MQGIHEFLAAFPGDQQQVNDGIPANSGQALNRANGASFNQHPNRHLAARILQVIFNRESRLVGFGEGLPAGQATKAAKAITMMAKAL